MSSGGAARARRGGSRPCCRRWTVLLALKGVIEVGDAEEKEREKRTAYDQGAGSPTRLPPSSTCPPRGAALGHAPAGAGGRYDGARQRAELAPGRRPETIGGLPNRSWRHLSQSERSRS